MTTRRSLAAASVLLATALLPHPARATLYQWDGGLSHGTSADVNWSTGNNWVGGVAPVSSLQNTDLEFLGSAFRTASNNNSSYQGGASIHSLTFDAGTTAYGLTGNTIFIGAGGIVQNSTAAQTFTANVSLAATQNITFGPGAEALNFAGGLTVASGGSLTVSTPGIQFTNNSGLIVGGLNLSNPNSMNFSASSFTLTGGVTLSPASVTVGVYGNDDTSFTQDSGTLQTGSIILGRFSAGVFRLSGTGQVSATGINIGESVGSNFNQDGGSLTTNGGGLSVGSSGSSFHLKAGSVATGSLNIEGNGVGSFNQASGTVNVTGRLGIGANNRNTLGTYALGGGNLTAGSITIGTFGNGTFIQTGGNVTCNGAITLGNEGAALYTLIGDASSLNAGSISVGSAFLPALFTVSSGSVNVAAGGFISIGSSGAGTFTQNGGTVSIAQGGVVSMKSSGVYNLNGGTLTVGGLQGTQTSTPTPTTTFNLNGGTLQANVASTTFVTGLTHAYVQTGGAKVDSNGFNIKISQALVHDPALVGNARDGGLTKLGSGTLTLAGANTYNGGTLVAGGALEAAVNGALGTGNVMLGPNAFLLTLDATVSDAIADTASLSLDSTVGGKLQLLGGAGSVQEIVASLDINGIGQAGGTYGATGSGAQFIDDAHFSGTGVLSVQGVPGVGFNVLTGAVPEPGTGVLAGAGMLLAAVGWARRRKARIN